MSTELGKAYVQIIPSAEGIKGEITKALGGEAESAGKDAGSSFGSAFSTGLKAAGKVMAVGLAAVGTAAVAVGKQAIEAFADYEQLVGGVETLFKGSAGAVQEYAANAYKTAGLSANEYMETVTGFSASLLQSLGGDTEQAAKVADMAISDMSDNANKMGSSMEAIQTAYQGFAKQNYTMLDNLKLGYGGTKTEMERLLADATALSGIEYDIDSLADVYEAIHVIQGELDITGTTAKEASTTISGSLASMKSAWQNLLVGIADDNADFETLVGNFVDSVVTTGENIIPRVDSILGGLGELITQAAEKLVPIVVETLINNLPKIVESGVKLVATLTTAIVGAIPNLVKAIPEIIKAIVKGLADGWPQIKQAGSELVQMVGNGVKSVVSSAARWGRDLIQNFINGIKAKIGALKSAVSNIASTVKSLIGFSEPKEGPLSNFHTFAPDMMQLFANGIMDNKGLIKDAMSDIAGLTASSYETRFAVNASADGWRRTMATTSPAVSEDEPSNANAIAAAVAQALNGAIVNMDGRKVGALVTNYQRSAARTSGAAFG